MKQLLGIWIIAVVYVSACNEPLQITTKTDPQTTTSGTLGSEKASNQMPERRIDTPAGVKVDTMIRRRD
jgi:hypothetical protein